MRDEEERKKEASKVKQTTRQRNTAHPRQLLFLSNMSCLCTSIYIAFLSLFLQYIHEQALPPMFRKQLSDIIQRGPMAQIDELEKELIWRFRYDACTCSVRITYMYMYMYVYVCV